MKKEITLGQLVSTGAMLLVTIITGWITMNNKITRLEAKSEMNEKRWERVDAKLDENQKTLNAVLVELQNKQNRK